MITKEQADVIVDLVQSVRPTWDTPGILAALLKVRDRSLADITTAALNAAADPTMHTPKAISFTGPHWPKHGGSDGAMLHEPKCYICGHYRSECWRRHEFEIKHGTPDPHAFETAEDAERNAARTQLSEQVLARAATRTLGTDQPWLPPELEEQRLARADVAPAEEVAR